jgi:uncharacterized protein (DUF3820 family)
MDAHSQGGMSQELAEAFDAAYLELPEDKEEELPLEAWMNVVLPFGKEKGKKLGELPRNYLWGMAKNYEPKPWKGKISDKDKELRKALDEAMSYLDEHKDHQPSPTEEQPF